MWFRRKLKFKQLALEVLEQKKIRSVATYTTAKPNFNRLICLFGEMTLSQISEKHWHTYVQKRLEKRPGCKFFDDKKFMRQIMLEAHRRGLTKITLRLWIPDLPGTIGREIPQSERILLFKNASPDLQFQMEIAYLMGLRKMELFHMRWDRINWDRQTICFKAKEVKTRREKEVPIPNQLLEKFRERYFNRKSEWVWPRPSDPSRPRDHNRSEWATCKSKAKVEVRWHDWRHTCATEMLRRGGSIQAVKTFLGMSSHILTQIYQHLNIDDLRGVMISENSGKMERAAITL